MFEIEKGIAKPENTGLYPLSKMEVGDSFLVPCEKKDNAKIRGRLASACIRKSIRDKKFSVRAVDGGLRCWRIS